MDVFTEVYIKDAFLSQKNEAKRIIFICLQEAHNEKSSFIHGYEN